MATSQRSETEKLSQLIKADVERSMSKPHPSHVGNWKIGFWTTALHAASLDPKMSAQQLLFMFKECRSTYSCKPTIATYTAIIRGLIRKGDSYGNVLKVWKELRNSVTRLDKMAMTVGMDVLVGSGHALEAFQYIEELTSPNAVAALPIHRTRYFKAGSKPQVDTRLVDTILINSLMSALVAHGRPDVVFMLWDGMESAFGLQPDAETLTMVMKAAREAHKIDGYLQAMLAQSRTIMPGQEKRRMRGVEETSRDELVAEIQKALATELTADSEREERDDQKVFTWRTSVSCLWNGMTAGTKAIDLFRDLIYTNWPHLRRIQPPVKPNWSEEAQRNIARSFLFSSRTTESTGQDDSVSSPAPSLSTTPRDPPPQSPLGRLLSFAFRRPVDPYASVIPNEKTFAAYIALLGSQNRSSDIPLALAWMRELDIKPTKVTLARALALWSEVTSRGPLVEQSAPEDTREYEKLVEWLKEWLGEKGVVSESRVRSTLRLLKREAEYH